MPSNAAELGNSAQFAGRVNVCSPVTLYCRINVFKVVGAFVSTIVVLPAIPMLNIAYNDRPRVNVPVAATLL